MTRGSPPKFSPFFFRRLQNLSRISPCRAKLRGNAGPPCPIAKGYSGRLFPGPQGLFFPSALARRTLRVGLSASFRKARFTPVLSPGPLFFFPHRFRADIFFFCFPCGKVRRLFFSEVAEQARLPLPKLGNVHPVREITSPCRRRATGAECPVPSSFFPQ